MKKIVFLLLIAGSFHTASGQARGNWVVESNIHSPKNRLVKFYNAKQELIYEERFEGKRLRYEKLRVKKALDRMLDLALIQQEPVPQGSFAALLKSKKSLN